MKRIACLISGRGSNLESILRTAAAERWASEVPARVVAVVSNRIDAPGLAVAAAHGVPSAVIDQRRFASREAFDAALLAEVDSHRPDVVVLAGFMRVLTAPFVEHYRGRLINIHPSLLPSFPGLATHRRALAAGVRVHGATVHFVSNDVDGGAIIAQAVVPVLPGDEAESLAERVLQREHVLLPRCLRWLCEGKVALVDGRAVARDLPEGALAIFP
jgi:phosphoribosylglycinamide formyltransferase-1